MSVGTRTAPATGNGRIEAVGLSQTRLAWLQATHRRGRAVALWLCMAVALVLPVLLLLVQAAATRAALAEALTRDGGLTVEQRTPDVGSFNAFARFADGDAAARVGRQLVPLAAYATTGPLPLLTVNGQPAPAGARGPLTAAYLDHLVSHVQVSAGKLPPDGLGGGDTAVTLPQAGADQLGLHLSDRFCLGLAGGGQGPWCARIAGLWQPIETGDPFWGGQVPRLELTMGRYDFFQLAGLLPQQAPQAGIRFWADPRAVDPAQAAVTARQVRNLTTALQGPQRHVSTRLDRALLAFATGRTVATRAIWPFTLIAALIGLSVIVLLAGQLLDGQARGLAVLRARGWPRARVWRLAFASLGALALWGLLLGGVVCLLVLAALAASGWVLSPVALRPEDLVGVAVAGAAAIVAVLVALAVLSRRAARWDVHPSLEAPFLRPRAWWLNRGTAVVGIPVAVVALAVPHLADPASMPAAFLLALAPALGAVLLAAVAVGLRLLRAAAPGVQDGVPRALAGWQLQRAPEQHAGIAFVLALGAAGAVFAALSLALAGTQGLQGSEPALWQGLQAGLGIGAISALGLALAGFGVHFRSTTARRLREYGGLFAHGLDAPAVASSLAAEQSTAAVTAVAAGGALGLVLAVSVLPLAAPTPTFAELAAVGLAIVAALLTAGVAVVGSLARRVPYRLDRLREQRDQG